MDYSSPTHQSQAVHLNGEKKAATHCAYVPSVFVAGGLIRLSTKWLFQSAKEIEIEHRGDVYRLRQTALGKLILTK
jgi:hemin uptake protein HemP